MKITKRHLILSGLGLLPLTTASCYNRARLIRQHSDAVGQLLALPDAEIFRIVKKEYDVIFEIAGLFRSENRETFVNALFFFGESYECNLNQNLILGRGNTVSSLEDDPILHVQEIVSISKDGSSIAYGDGRNFEGSELREVVKERFDLTGFGFQRREIENFNLMFQQRRALVS